MRPSAVLSLALLASLALQAKGLQDKFLEAKRLNAPLKLDGKLTEPAWAEAPEAAGFTTSWPEFGKDSALDTRVKVLYTDRHVYIGARLKNPKGREGIVRRLHRRDQDSTSDWFTVYIDSLHDRNTAWAFMVNAAGVQRDALCYADTRQDSSWDGVWESAVSVDDEGWSVEMRIPLSLLRIKAEDGPQTWGINFSRSDQGPLRERSSWFQPPRGIGGFVSTFPELRGIEGVKPQPRREFIPYLSSQRKFETSQPYDDRGWTQRAGMDLHLGLNTHSQVDATILPDFGQVEVDQAVINLGTVETFFPEKRPFFLEGMELFQFPELQLFYSRRVGRGVGAPVTASDETVVDAPLSSEILGAGKYTAKFSSGLNVALLGANVQAARARIRQADGSDTDRELAPMANYGVLRVQQALDQRGSYVGAMGTWHRQSGASGREARVGGLDSAWKSEDRSLTLEATAAQSQAGPAGQQVSGGRQQLHAVKQWGNGTILEGRVVNADRDFNPNDMGYLSRADERRASVMLLRSIDRSWRVFRNFSWELDATQATDQAGTVIQRGYSASWRMDTIWYNGIWVNAGSNAPVHDDRELRTFRDPQKKYLQVDPIPWVNLGFDTAANRPWYVRLSANREWQEGGTNTDLSLAQTLKLNSALELTLETRGTRNLGERKWSHTTDDGTPVTGLRRMTQLNQTLRVAYAFTPALTVQAFGQWLAASYAYRDFRAWAGNDSLVPAAAPPQTAFSTRVWNLNLIGRWEFRPGSTAFLVYTKGASSSALLNGHGGLSPWSDLKSLQHLPSDDAVQVKVSWLFR